MGKLYVVPTPVGNLEDMTFRAIRILKEADLILAEDTRTSGILLKHFEIKNAMQSHHKFNEHKMVESVVNRIKAGETVALISDAGTAYDLFHRYVLFYFRKDVFGYHTSVFRRMHQAGFQFIANIQFHNHSFYCL